jgi:uroporphyrin-III C-methyltransferase
MTWTAESSLARRPAALGMVSLVGAGPGDPELITVRGLRRLRGADILLYDRLIHPDLVDEAPAEAERIFVGKAPGRPGVGQAAIHRLMIDHARRGRAVVRLKGGDPFVFGRGGEEAAALTEAGVPWEVVPAVSSSIGVPAMAGIPVTHREVARSFAVVTAHQLDGGGPDWKALAGVDTLVVLMGVGTLDAVAAALIDAGRDPSTPVAVIARGTLPDERTIVGCLADVAGKVAEAFLRPPATVVVGEVVGLRLEPSPWPAFPLTVSKGERVSISTAQEELS